MVDGPIGHKALATIVELQQTATEFKTKQDLALALHLVVLVQPALEIPIKQFHVLVQSVSES